MKRRASKRRRNARVNESMKHTVVYVDLTPAEAGNIMTGAVKVSEVLSGADPAYGYRLNHLSIELMAPAQVTGDAGTFTAVSMCTAQIYGYMQQDQTLQRSALSTWRDLSLTKPTKFSFRKSYLRTRIYAGGFVPITNINDDEMMGIHAVWKAGSATAPASLQMALTAKMRFSFNMSQDLQITAVNPFLNRVKAPDVTDKDVDEPVIV